MRRTLVLLFVFFLTSLTGSACGSSNGNIYGKYVSRINQSRYLEIRSDGTFYLAGKDDQGLDVVGRGTWKKEGNELFMAGSVSGTKGGQTVAFNPLMQVTFKIDGNKVRDPGDQVWEKR